MKLILIIVGVLAVALLSLYFLGRKTVNTQIDIAAPPEEIWAVLLDAKRYPEWNPILEPLSGTYKAGETITYRMTIDGESSEVSSTVVGLVPNKELNQFGGVVGILTFDHHWVLEPIEGGTRVTQYENYRGIAVPFWNPASVKDAYEEANRQLAELVMALRQN
ncbi:MAG: SRPBCC domain-containing protein [Xanthomonadales bacterium]|nr:SRPBCC domain-containing protein [Xanthomonadales bacterium]